MLTYDRLNEMKISGWIPLKYQWNFVEIVPDVDQCFGGKFRLI